MARKRIIKKTSLTSWEDVNEALRLIAEKQSFVDHKVAKHNEVEARRRKLLDDAINPLKLEIEKLEEEMSLFSEDHRADFGEKKGLELANGSVSFRTGTPKVKTLTGYTFAAVLKIVESLKVLKYVRTKKELNRENIIAEYIENRADEAKAEAFEDKLAGYGIKVVQDETFGYDVKVASEADQAA